MASCSGWEHLSPSTSASPSLSRSLLSSQRRALGPSFPSPHTLWGAQPCSACAEKVFVRLSSVSRDSLALPLLLSLWKSFLLSSCCPMQCRQMVPVAAVALQLCCCTQDRPTAAPHSLLTLCCTQPTPAPSQRAHAQVMGSGHLTDSSNRLGHTSPLCTDNFSTCTSESATHGHA